MPNLNRVELMGNMTRDAELKYTPRGTAVAEFGLAINRTWKDDSGQKKEEVTFVDITFWGRMAEIVSEYGGKGKPLYVEGRLSLDTWEDKQTGQKRSRLKIVGEGLQLLGGRPDGSRTQSEGRASQPARRAPSPQEDLERAARGDDDDIPF